MRVAMIDPSLFTLPYDAALCGGLAEAGAEVTLYGRPLRAGERLAPSAWTFVPHFYRWSEHLPKSAGSLRLATKAGEHVWDSMRFLAELRRFRPDVIHLQWMPFPSFDRKFLALLKGIAPVVFTLHDSLPFQGTAGSSLQMLGATAAWREMDRVITHTGWTQRNAEQQGVTPARIAVIPHGLLAGGPQGATAAPGRPSDRVRLLMFGELKPYKGADLLIAALGLLPGDLRERVRLRIAGQAKMDVAPLQAEATRLGIGNLIDWDLRFVPDDEVPALYEGCDLLVLPYRNVDASGVLSLAMAHGKPVIVTRVGGFAETIEDGVHGRVVPPEAPRALTAAITDLVSHADVRAAMAANMLALGRSAVPSWRRIGEMTLDLYRSTARADAA